MPLNEYPWRVWLRKLPSRIAVRMLAFNVLLVFLPVAGLLYLDTYEEHLLDAQERSMVQQGRLLAAALAERDTLDADTVVRVLKPLGQRGDARLRVIDAAGHIVADTSSLGLAEPEPSTASPYGASTPAAGASAAPNATAGSKTTRESWLYRLGSRIIHVLRGVRRQLFSTRRDAFMKGAQEEVRTDDPAQWPEVQAALAGRYGSATRLTRGGQRSVTLYSAVPIQSGPIRSGARVTGVVLVSQSTYRLLQAIYDVRLRIFEAVVGSLLVAAVLTAIVAATIATPIRRLRREAAALLDHRGRLTRRFQASTRRDEIGDLARALEELTRRLDEHLKFVEAFSADVSHEFKNPLASIRTIADMLASVDDPVQRDRFLAMMARDVDRLERLLSGVREIATIDAQLEREATANVDVRSLVTNVADAHRLRADGRVRVDIDAPVAARVRAAPERLAQVFDNLVDNAIGFSPDGGLVTIRVGRDNGHCHVSVSDEGPGIPEAHLTRIFERFFSYRPDVPDGRRHHTGLGLAIAKAIVDSYGGSIAASNRSPRGACIDVRLPSHDPL